MKFDYDANSLVHREFGRTSNVTAKIQKRREEFIKEKFPYFRGAVTDEMPKRGRK